MGLPETAVGLVPGGGGTQLLARRAGPGVAADLIFTARRVSAGEAQRLGLVDRLVERGAAPATALELARAWRIIRPLPSGPPSERCDWEPGSTWRPPWRSRTRPGGPQPLPPTAAEGIKAFVEKRAA